LFFLDINIINNARNNEHKNSKWKKYS